MTADEVIGRLAELEDPARAATSGRYLGVVPGGYGEGDVLLGIPVPAQRRIAREARDLPLDEVSALLESPVHEHRFVGLVVLVQRYRRAGRAAAAELSAFYLRHRGAVNNWDLVDSSAPDLVGGELVAGTSWRELDALAGSAVLWDRRIAMLATGALIKRGEFATTLALAERFLGDPHHLMHKATGWMLREVGKRDEAVLVEWLERHRDAMPRTMLRYAIEKLDPQRRAALMARA
jgi:3-methyladenine DNA glycosylase AlkD